MTEPLANPPLLDIDTLIKRPPIAIDGVRYEMLSPGELTVLQTHRFAAMGRRIEEIMATDNIEAIGEAELGRTLVELSDALMEPVPQEVRDKLTDAHRLGVVEVFTVLLLRNRMSAVAAITTNLTPTPHRSTGATSSPGSSASSVVRRIGGWLRRLWPW